MARALTAAPSSRARVRRGHDRAVYDRAAIEAILDAALVCHLGFEHEGQPFVIPTLHARIADRLYVHGSSASRAVRWVAAGIPACATVTLVDGIVLARSVFEHSINYRSVVVLGTATAGRRARREARSPRGIHGEAASGPLGGRTPALDGEELKATGVLSLPLDEASAKVRVGPPDDGASPDAELDVWAGVIPLVTRRLLRPFPTRCCGAGIPVPRYAHRYRRQGLTG